MNATQKNIELHRRASYRGINLPLNDASTLRRSGGKALAEALSQRRPFSVIDTRRTFNF